MLRSMLGAIEILVGSDEYAGDNLFNVVNKIKQFIIVIDMMIYDNSESTIWILINFKLTRLKLPAF